MYMVCYCDATGAADCVTHCRKARCRGLHVAVVGEWSESGCCDDRTVHCAAHCCQGRTWRCCPVVAWSRSRLRSSYICEYLCQSHFHNFVQLSLSCHHCGPARVGGVLFLVATLCLFVCLFVTTADLVADFPRQQWSLLNHFCTEQGHFSACRRKWRLKARL